MFPPKGKEYAAVWSALSAKAQSESREAAEQLKTPFERICSIKGGKWGVANVETKDGKIGLVKNITTNERGETTPTGVSIFFPVNQGHDWSRGMSVVCVNLSPKGLARVQLARGSWEIDSDRYTAGWLNAEDIPWVGKEDRAGFAKAAIVDLASYLEKCVEEEASLAEATA